MLSKRFTPILPLVFVLAALSPPAVADQHPRSFAISAGVFNTNRPTDFEAGIEYRGPTFRWGLQAAAGFMVTSETTGYVYGGLRRDFDFGTHRWGVALSLGAGLYHQGDGRELGGPFNFRTGIELYRRFDTPSRLGLVFYHLSNAGLYEYNPGSNSLVLSYGLALGR